MDLLFLWRQRNTSYSLSDHTIMWIAGGIVLVSTLAIILIIRANRK
ncbi:hypothetical protein ACYATP_07815 [Lactobacillaceae bacterium Melli_B4]